MPLSSSNAVRQLSDQNSQGTVLGAASTDLISFYNATPVARTTQSFSTLSASSGALASTLVMWLATLGIIQPTTTITA